MQKSVAHNMQSDLDGCLSFDKLCFAVCQGLRTLSYSRQPLPVVTASLLLFLHAITIGHRNLGNSLIISKVDKPWDCNEAGCMHQNELDRGVHGL